MVNERLAAVQARSQGSLRRRRWQGELSMATVCLSFHLMSDPPDLAEACEDFSFRWPAFSSGKCDF